MKRTLILLLFSCFTGVYGQPVSDVARRASWIIQQVQEKHYSARPLDESFSRDFYDAILHHLDPWHNYLSVEDLAELEPFRTSLADMVQQKQDVFVKKLTEIFGRRMQEFSSTAHAVLAEPVSFPPAAKVHIYNDPESYSPVTEAELTLQWHKMISMRLLGVLFTTGVDSGGYKPEMAKQLLAAEGEARQKLLRKIERRLKDVLEKPSETVEEAYLTALANMFDPHTTYFPPEKEEMFAASLSGEGKSFGLRLGENNAGEVTISELIPGGPAWRSSQLHEGDILLSFRQQGKGETDLTLAGAGEADYLMREAASAPVILTVQKKNGTTREVNLIPEVLRDEENIVKSFMLAGKGKVGYISLPGFYTSYDSDEAGGCARDVATAVMKLMQDGMEGLIIDLRNNGGGSMREAMDLSGMFIDGGPLWIRRTKNNERFTLKDANRGAIYTGPLLILVNGESASASEFFAAAMQDHGRAIVAGSSTYGKATSQNVFPLEPEFGNTAYGSVKITRDRYYHLDGTTHQVSGVQPDIPLPDPYHDSGDFEKDEPHAFPADTIVKKVYYEPQPLSGLDGLRAASAGRVRSSADFGKYTAAATAWAKFNASDTSIALTPAAVFGYLDKEERLSEASEVKPESESPFLVQDNSYDKTLLQVDEYARSVQENLRNLIAEDLYIREAWNILLDMLHK